MGHELRCPAAEEAHPVLSPNDLDIRCQISGNLQPAEGSPCTGEYTGCRIWLTAKREEAVRGARALRGLRRDRDVLDDDLPRERIQVGHG